MITQEIVDDIFDRTSLKAPSEASTLVLRRNSSTLSYFEVFYDQSVSHFRTASRMI